MQLQNIEAGVRISPLYMKEREPRWALTRTHEINTWLKECADRIIALDCRILKAECEKIGDD